jgi:ferredoxin-type protein NapF
MAETDLKRRNFLRGRVSGAVSPLRPPWALAEAEFLDACTRCGDCRDACEESIIIVGSGGYPEVSFASGECTFCGDCVTSCQDGALLSDQNHLDEPWGYKAHIQESCLALNAVVCRACADACDVSAIKFTPQSGGVSSPVISQSNCTGCGACVSVCPVSSVQVLSA